MPLPVAIIDTSVLISLQASDLLGPASVLFHRILVPRTARTELKAGGEANRDALNAIEEFAFFEPCDDFDPALVRLLLDSRTALNRGGRDQGEAEAVIQAAQRSADMVLIDDQLGRKWASNHALECHGAIWYARELRLRGYLSELRPHFMRMIQAGRRQPRIEMNKYLLEFGEPPID